MKAATVIEHEEIIMDSITRRTALTTAAATGAGLAAKITGSLAQEEELTKDQQFVLKAGMTAEEADCWKKIAETAGAFFNLPELHPMDKQEVATAIHVVQNKLLARPTYRKYLELAKAERGE